MKYTIEGFSQEYAIMLKKQIEDKGKIKTIKIDCTDLVILRWFVDFYPKMRKMSVDGEEYAMLVHNKLKSDLPILDISKKACIDRMRKLVEFGILKYKCVKEGGTFSLYAFGENYENMISSNTQREDGQTGGGCTVNHTRGARSTIHGVHGQPDNKDNTIIYTSTNNESIKERKKGTFDEIIHYYSNGDEEVEDLLKEWLKVRKAKRAAMTDKAIELNVSKMNMLATKSNMPLVTYLQEVIRRGWTAFYEIKTYERPQNKQSGGNVFLEIAKDEGIF